MGVSPQYVINLKGKQFVLFAGLLDLAHQMGLFGVETEIIPELSNPAERSWVIRATAKFSNEKGGATYSAYGDASPANTQLRGAELRHAETRAIARALRMGTNVGMTAAEELGPDVDEEPAPRPAARATRQYDEATAQAAVNQAAGKGALACDQCGAAITTGQNTLSRQRHGKPLCPACQRALGQQTARIAASPAV